MLDRRAGERQRSCSAAVLAEAAYAAAMGCDLERAKRVVHSLDEAQAALLGPAVGSVRFFV